MTIEQQAAAIAARRRAAIVGRIAEGVKFSFPDLEVTPVPEGVAIAGRGVMRRRIADAELRTIGARVPGWLQ